MISCYRVVISVLLLYTLAIAEYAEKYKHILTPDEGAPYDRLIEIDLDEVCC